VVSVPWDELHEPQYADLASRLLVRLHPDAEVMDGSGGDGGRDVQLRIAGQLIIFELKSFTGRLSTRSPARRKQVEKSLVAAAKLKPAEWYLVVPINHNPDELQWFDNLRKKYRFILRWRGLTWLNTQLDAHPDLIRGALNDINDELLYAIREHHAERDTLVGGVPDLVARAEALARRANEVSPDYRLETAYRDGGTGITVIAKDPDAAERAPITFSGTLEFATDTPAGNSVYERVRDAMDYGGAFEVSGDIAGPFTLAAPPELGISRTSRTSKLWVATVPDKLNPPVRGTLTALSAAGFPQQNLEVVFAERLDGQRGFTVHGSDVTGLLAIKVRVDTVTRAGLMTLAPTGAAPGTPAASLPALRFIAAVRPPHLLRLVFQLEEVDPIDCAATEQMPDDHLLEVTALVEQLGIIQDHTKSMFAVPKTLTRHEAGLIEQSAQLIAGEHVAVASGRVKLSFTPSRPGPLPSFMADEFRVAYAREQTVVRIGGRELDLGPSITYINRCSPGQR